MFRLNVIWVTAGLLLQVTVLIVGILAMRRGLAHARLYLLGHGAFFIAASLFATLTLGNQIHDLSVALTLQPLVVLLHLTTMLVTEGRRARETRARLRHQQQALMEQARFVTVGKTIGMLAHQWRAPLARLGAQLTELRAYFRFAGDLREQAPLIRDELLPAMQDGLQHMARTVEDFQDFFSADHPTEVSSPRRWSNGFWTCSAPRSRALACVSSARSSRGPGRYRATRPPWPTCSWC